MKWDPQTYLVYYEGGVPPLSRDAHMSSVKLSTKEVLRGREPNPSHLRCEDTSLLLKVRLESGNTGEKVKIIKL